MMRDDLFAGYEQGQADMLAKCIATVEGELRWYNASTLEGVLVALRALEEKFGTTPC